MSKKRSAKRKHDKNLAKTVNDAYQILCEKIESDGLDIGTSLSTGIGLVSIQDNLYEIQIRVEKDKESFLGNSYCESYGFNQKHKKELKN